MRFHPSACLLSICLFPQLLTAQDADAAAHALRASNPTVAVALDHRLGVAHHVASPDGPIAHPHGRGIKDEAARGFLDAWPDLLGGDASILDNAVVLRDDVTAHSGLHTKVWQQHLEGIPIHGGELVANTDRHGALIAIGSGFIPAPDRSPAGVAARIAHTAKPAQDAAAAVTAALRRLQVQDTDARVSNVDGGPNKRTRLTSSGALGDVTTSLTWFPLAAGNLRLAWDVLLVERTHGIMYAMVVDAETLAVLSSVRLTSPDLYSPQQLKEPRGKAAPVGARAIAPAPLAGIAKPAPSSAPVRSISAASATAIPITLTVFTGDSPTPFSPGYNAPNSTPPAGVARSSVTLTSLDATASPGGWIDSNKDTRGNNVDAHLDLNHNNVADTPRPAGTGSSPVVYDFPLNLANAPATYRDAAVTNLFYWCNFAHDRLYGLGFTETAGNFQTDNFERGGQGNDALQADAQDGGGTNNANFSTPPDGTAPRMQMFLFTKPNPDRDGCFDATVVLHEYVHGLTGRLVGGGGTGNLDALQSGGMGEGWSDFYALSLLSDPSDDPLGTYAAGSYVTENYFRGIRRYPYAIEPGPVVTSDSLNPLTFDDIRINTEVHLMGEVWCQALWECRGELIARHGAATGNTLMLQLVTDGLKLTPSNPTFLQARDAILQADLAATGGANAAALWRAFAKRGLGRGASAGNSNDVASVGQSFEDSPVFRVSNAAGLRAAGRRSQPGTFTPTSTTFTVTNVSGVTITWSLAKNSVNYTLSPASPAPLGPGASATVTCSLVSSAYDLPVGTWSDSITFTDLTHGLTVVRPVTVRSLPVYTISTESMSWIDPTGHGTLALDDFTGTKDDNASTVTLPFRFLFYGDPVNEIHVGSNGLMCFDTDDGVYSPFNDPLPTADAPNNVVATLWQDLNPQAAGSVRFAVTGVAGSRKAVTSWVGIPPFDDPSLPMTVQVVLDEATNDIVMNYQEVQTADDTYGGGASATIGLEDISGKWGDQFSDFGSTLVSNGTAIRYHFTLPAPNGTPIVATAAVAGALDGTKTMTTVSVLGDDDGGEAALVYTWSLGGSPTSLFTCASNGNNAAKTTSVTFARPGTFPLQVTITDALGATVTSSVNVIVPEVATGLAIDPPNVAVAPGATATFGAFTSDQFGNPMLGTTPTVTWSTSIGSISSTGVFTAPSSAGTAQITADNGVGGIAHATVTVGSGGSSGGHHGGGGGGGGCGLGATSAFAAALLLLIGWRRRRLGD